MPRVPWSREQSYLNVHSIQPLKFTEFVRKASGKFDARVMSAVGGLVGVVGAGLSPPAPGHADRLGSQQAAGAPALGRQPCPRLRAARPETLSEPAMNGEVSRQCPLAHTDLTSLWRTLDQHVPENRAVHGLRHRQPTVLTIEDHPPPRWASLSLSNWSAWTVSATTSGYNSYPASILA